MHLDVVPLFLQPDARSVPSSPIARDLESSCSGILLVHAVINNRNATFTRIGTYTRLQSPFTLVILSTKYIRHSSYHTENFISLRQRYRIINLLKTYERYVYRY